MRMGMGFDVFRRAPGEYVPPDVGTIEAFDSENNLIAPILHNGYNYWAFTQDSGTLTVTGNPVVDLLLVGGGGGGANATAISGGGGGGGGGKLLESDLELAAGDYIVVRGAGGAASTDGNGTKLLLDGEPVPLFEAFGGGAGGIPYDKDPEHPELDITGNPGGCGGGGGSGVSTSSNNVGGVGSQGGNGGTGRRGAGPARVCGGGGGGAKPANGVSAVVTAGSSTGGGGGEGYDLNAEWGLTNGVIGELVIGVLGKLAGGGGGGAYESTDASVHNIGVDGGGAGGNYNPSNKRRTPGDGLDGTGGGGGGGCVNQQPLMTGGAGGSGIAIIRMEVAK